MQERDVRLFLPQDEEYLELRNNPQCTMSLFGLNLLFYFQSPHHIKLNEQNEAPLFDLIDILEMKIICIKN